MFLPIVECICIPSDEGEAVPYLAFLVENHPEIASRAEGTLAATGSARAVLESLVEDGTFERISEDYARCLEEEACHLEAEARRYEAEERGRAQADVAADAEPARPA